MVEVTDEDRAAAKQHQQRFLTEGASETSLLWEAFARHRIAAEQRGKLEGARLALEAAANGLEAYAKAYTEQKERAKADKDRKAARDFESMAMTCAFRSTEIRALSPAKIVGEG